MPTQNISLINSRTEQYTDLDIMFRQRPNTHDLNKKHDVEAVKQSVINILLTNSNERVFSPYFGGDLRSYLFEYFDDITAHAIKSRIISTLNNYEPRVEVISIEVSDVENASTQDGELSIHMEILIKSISEQTTHTVNFTVERLR
jgi:phage baseplate assembly protein W